MVVIFSSHLSLIDRTNRLKTKCDMNNTKVIVDLLDSQTQEYI